jgi:hypothetical protein
VRLVRQLQPHPDRLATGLVRPGAGGNPLGRVRHQLGTHFRGGDDRFGKILGVSQREKVKVCYQNKSKQRGTKETSEGHGAGSGSGRWESVRRDLVPAGHGGVVSPKTAGSTAGAWMRSCLLTFSRPNTTVMAAGRTPKCGARNFTM